MKQCRRFLSMLLALVLCLSLAAPALASGETYSGTCGDNLTWTLDTATGVLTISGSGAMADYYWLEASSYEMGWGYSATRVLWNSYRSSIKSVVIQPGVTYIGSNAFADCASLTSVTIPDSVTEIGAGAFNNCNSLTDVYYSGTEEQWNNISIGNFNNPLRNAERHYISPADD